MRSEKLNPTLPRPVAARSVERSPESDGTLFPKEQTLLQVKFTGARDMVADLLSPGHFQISPALRAHESAFAEGGRLSPDLAVSVLHDALGLINDALARGERQPAFRGFAMALGALHTPTTVPSTEGEASHGMPLQAFFSEPFRTESLARLSFSFAELSFDQEDQRTVLQNLDRMLDILPNPLEGDVTTPRQRLLRMFSHIYMGRALEASRTIQEAIKQYEMALQINDLHEPSVEEARLIAHAELINLHFKRAYKLYAEKKHRRFLSHIDEIQALRHSIEEKLSLGKARSQEALTILRQDLATHFWRLGLFERSYQELYGLQERFGGREADQLLRRLIAESQLSPRARKQALSRFFDDAGQLHDPDRLTALPAGARVWQFVAQTLKNAHRPTSFETFLSWAGGSALFAGSFYLASRGDASFAELLAASGTGAALLDGAKRLINGAHSYKTAEARRIGFNDVAPTQAFLHAAGFAANTLIPYAIMGGALPGLGAASDIPLIGNVIEPTLHSSLASGSLIGPGALIPGAISTMSQEASIAAGIISQQGSASALTTYLEHMNHTTLGSTVASAGNYWGGALSSLIDGSLIARVGEMAGGAFTAHPAATALNTYKALSLGYYAAARLSPGFRKHYGALGSVFVPGGLLIAADFGEALGAYPGHVNVGPLQIPLNLVGTAGVGALYQGLAQWLIGNKGLREMQWFNLIGAGLLINMYVGVSSNFDPIVQSHSLGQMIAESVGRQLGLFPIIFAHGAMLMVDPRRFAEQKAARLLAYDHIGNVMRIAMGQWDGFLPVFAGVTTGFLVTNSLLGRTFNDLAGSKPAALSFATMLRNAAGRADEQVLHALTRSLRRLPVAAPLTKMSPETLTLPARAFYHSLTGKRLARYMLPEEKSYRMVYDALTEEGALDAGQVATLLSATRTFLNRSEDADVARGLTYVLGAARQGPHGEQIRRFFEQHRDVYARLRIDREITPLPADRGAREAALWEELRYPYRTYPEQTVAPSVIIEQGRPQLAGMRPSLIPAMSAGMLCHLPLAAYMNAHLPGTIVM